MLDFMEGRYEKTRIIRVNKHDYLGMDLGCFISGEVRKNMVYYHLKVINNFPEEIIVCATIPAMEHMFKVRDGKKRVLPDEKYPGPSTNK